MRKVLFLFVFFLISNFVAAGSEEVVRKHEGIPGSEDYMRAFFINNREIARQKISIGPKGNSFGLKVVHIARNIPDGIVKEYYPSGELMAEINYRNNKEHGLAKSYYKSDALQTESNSTNGVGGTT